MPVHIEDFGPHYSAARRRSEQLRTPARCIRTGKIIEPSADAYAEHFPIEPSDGVQHWRVVWRD